MALSHDFQEILRIPTSFVSESTHHLPIVHIDNRATCAHLGSKSPVWTCPCICFCWSNPSECYGKISQTILYERGVSHTAVKFLPVVFPRQSVMMIVLTLRMWLFSWHQVALTARSMYPRWWKLAPCQPLRLCHSSTEGCWHVFKPFTLIPTSSLYLLLLSPSWVANFPHPHPQASVTYLDPAWKIYSQIQSDTSATSLSLGGFAKREWEQFWTNGYA